MGNLFHTIRTASTISNDVVVAFSGGKESIVTLDLCAKHFKRVEAFFMWYVPDLSFQEETLRRYETAYGIAIHRLPHFELSDQLRFGMFCDPDEEMERVGVNDIYRYVRNLTGIHWIAAGERIKDSLVRRAMIKASGTVDPKRGRFYPLAEWSKQDVVDYITKNRLRLGRDTEVLGFSFAGTEGRAMVKIKEHFPDDYERIKRFFPKVEAVVLNHEMRERAKHGQTNEK